MKTLSIHPKDPTTDFEPSVCGFHFNIDLNSQNMKCFFMIATMLALACFFLSETKGEMFASGAAISLGIALFGNKKGD